MQIQSVDDQNKMLACNFDEAEVESFKTDRSMKSPKKEVAKEL
jgi:hypothetical protein